MRNEARARENRRKRSAEVFAERRPMINRIKTERGCADCGYAAHPAALHFDHRDPTSKRFNISGSEGRNLADLLAEIDKCDVRCANCHAVRSSTQTDFKRGRPRRDADHPVLFGEVS